jgi:hypothetical protein
MVECAHSMMKGKNLSNAFWAEAINTAIYLNNRSPTRHLDNVTPFEALYGSKPAVHNLNVFGCKDFAHIPKENRNKLDAKSIKVFSLGIVLNSKHINYLILLLTKYLQVEMYFSMSRKQEIMKKIIMRNDIELLMKDLRKSNNKNHHINDHNCSSSHNRNDNSNNIKDSMLWTLQAITFHLVLKTDLHKVGRKIIS